MSSDGATSWGLKFFLLIVLIFWSSGAVADCDISPVPPTPETCDPGGEGSEAEILACDFDPFTFGASVTVGTGGTSAATSIPRRTVFEGQASADINNCDVFDPENPEIRLFNADARAVAASDAFEVGVALTDYEPGRGDPFNGTLEAADARAAAAFASISGVDSSQDLDAVIHVAGSFLTLGPGRAGVQLAVRDLQGRILGAMFIANESPPLSSTVWRYLSCPDPRNDPDCSSGMFEDMSSSFPGTFDLPIKVPAILGNGLWVELKAEAPLDDEAGPGATLSVSFANTATVEILPPDGASVTLSSGQVFGEPPPPPEIFFDVYTNIEEFNAFDEDFVMGEGDTVETAESTSSVTTATARGIAGSGRLVVETEKEGEVGCSGQATAALSWSDTITASGADSYRFEIELVGDAEVIAPPVTSFLSAGYQVGLNVGGVNARALGSYNAQGRDGIGESCSAEADGDECFNLNLIPDGIPVEVVGTGDLGVGPVVVAFDFPLQDGVPADLEFEVRARTEYSESNTTCVDTPFILYMDLGTDGHYARLLEVTAETGGAPDENFTIQSTGGYDYSQPRPLVLPVPEPGSSLSSLVALGSVAIVAARRRRG